MPRSTLHTIASTVFFLEPSVCPRHVSVIPVPTPRPVAAKLATFSEGPHATMLPALAAASAQPWYLRIVPSSPLVFLLATLPPLTHSFPVCSASVLSDGLL